MAPWSAFIDWGICVLNIFMLILLYRLVKPVTSGNYLRSNQVLTVSSSKLIACYNHTTDSKRFHKVIRKLQSKRCQSDREDRPYHIQNVIPDPSG
jgi:hypothetical protein